MCEQFELEGPYSSSPHGPFGLCGKMDLNIKSVSESETSNKSSGSSALC